MGQGSLVKPKRKPWLRKHRRAITEGGANLPSTTPERLQMGERESKRESEKR